MVAREKRQPVCSGGGRKPACLLLVVGSSFALVETRSFVMCGAETGSHEV